MKTDAWFVCICFPFVFVIALVNFCVMGIESILCVVNEINLMYSELDLCFSYLCDG